MKVQTGQQQNWWQKNKKLLMRTGLIALLVVVIALIILIILGYILNWDWTGLNANFKTQPTPNIIIYQPGKTLWDWLGLLGVLAIPVVVGLFTFQQGRASDKSRQQQKQTELEIATDYQREQALQAYIDKISELLLKEHLGELTADDKLNPEDERAEMIARVRTITVLTQLDARRVGYVFAFLHEAGLMSTKLRNNAVSLSDADLRTVDWSQANLEKANLSGANLNRANLSGANLSEANLFKANLSNVDLSNADLEWADLGGADLSNAFFHKSDLRGADLRGANLSNAILWSVNLSNAYLSRADLRGADLTGAILREAYLDDANLKGAIGVTVEELEKQAKSLKGATMPDGTIHP